MESGSCQGVASCKRNSCKDDNLGGRAFSPGTEPASHRRGSHGPAGGRTSPPGGVEGTPLLPGYLPHHRAVGNPPARPALSTIGTLLGDPVAVQFVQKRVPRVGRGRDMWRPQGQVPHSSHKRVSRACFGQQRSGRRGCSGDLGVRPASPRGFTLRGAEVFTCACASPRRALAAPAPTCLQASVGARPPSPAESRHLALVPSSWSCSRGAACIPREGELLVQAPGSHGDSTAHPDPIYIIIGRWLSGAAVWT